MRRHTTKGLTPLAALATMILLAALLVSCAGLLIRSDAKRSFEQGMALFNQGKYEEAIPYFQKATELDPDYADPYLYLGRSYISLRRWFEALPPLRTAYRLAPVETKKEVLNILLDGLIGAAGAEFSKGNFSRSLDYLKEGLNLSPQSGQTKNELVKTFMAYGSQLLSEGKISDAVSAYSEALDLSPDNSEAMVGLARAFLKNGELFKAMQTLQDVLKIDPANANALSLYRKLFGM